MPFPKCGTVPFSQFCQPSHSGFPAGQALSEARFFQSSQSNPSRPGSARKFPRSSGHIVLSPQT